MTQGRCRRPAWGWGDQGGACGRGIREGSGRYQQTGWAWGVGQIRDVGEGVRREEGSRVIGRDLREASAGVAVGDDGILG